MSITGRSNNRSSLKSVAEFSDGFTLIEISIVILLMGFLLSVTVPAIRENFLTDDLKAATRKLTATINFIKNRSVSNYEDHILVINIEKGKYWYEAEHMNEKELEEARKRAVNIPDGIRIEDIHIKDSGKIFTGEAAIRFTKKGYNRLTLIHIGSNKDDKFSFLIRPFLGKVKILEDYVDFEEIFRRI
ncbi:Tfp pilus assembly protein FimT/FimU [Thermodesulfobacteriota bacterium]